MIPKLRYILQDKGHDFIKNYCGKISVYVVSVLLAVLNCGTERNGYRSFFCVKCQHVKRISFTCKKRLCPTCSQWANRSFAINFIQRMLPVTHRHLTMSIPEMLWNIFHDNPKLKKLLIKAAYKTIREAMCTYLPVNIMPAALCVLHNFARDLKKNCHVHTIVTEGGMYKGKWYRFTFFPFVKMGKIHTTINEMWRDNVLEILRLALPRTKKNAMFIAAVRRKYPKGFYVYGPKESRIKTNRTAYNKAKYITRYVRHPPISDNRIASYDGESVTFWYDHPSTGKRYHLTLPVLEFIYAVVMHLPEKGFNMVISYGLYSPSYVNKPIVQTIFSVSGEVVDPKDLSWREMMILQNGVDPLACPYCNERMVEVCIVYKRRDKLKVGYYLLREDLDAIEYPDECKYVDKIS